MKNREEELDLSNRKLRELTDETNDLKEANAKMDG